MNQAKKHLHNTHPLSGNIKFICSHFKTEKEKLTKDSPFFLFLKLVQINIIFQVKPNLAGMILGWVPFKIVSDRPALHSRWLLLLKIEICSIVHCCFIVNRNENTHPLSGNIKFICSHFKTEKEKLTKDSPFFLFLKLVQINIIFATMYVVKHVLRGHLWNKEKVAL
jgi:hypothetical protein